MEALQADLASGNGPHAYLITGPPRTGKSLLARELAMAFNCTSWQGEAQNSLFGALQPAAATGRPAPCYDCASCIKALAGSHPDITVLDEWTAERSSIIDQVRAVQYASNLLPYEGRWKVYALLHADQLTLPAQNALLKTLEEPAASVRIILTAPAAQSLLPTVVSRCRPVPLRLVARADIAAAIDAETALEPGQSEDLAGLAAGRIGWALEAAREPRLLEMRRAALAHLVELLGASTAARFRAAEQLAASAASDPSELTEVLALWLSWLRDLLLVAEGCPRLMVNGDHATTLARAAAQCPPTEVRRAVQAVQRTIAHVAGNTNTRLALEVLMLHLPALSPAAIG